VLIARSKTRY